MRIFGKRFFLLVMISVLSVNLIFCGKKEEKNIKNDVVEKVEEKTQEKDAAVETETKKSSEEEEIAYEKGLDEEFTTDGKLHEEKFLNKNFGYPDTAVLK